MSKRELSRLEVIEMVESKRLKQLEGAAQLGITVRHLRRLQGAYCAHGVLGLVSKRRGKVSNNRLSAAFKAEVMSLVREH